MEIGTGIQQGGYTLILYRLAQHEIYFIFTKVIGVNLLGKSFKELPRRAIVCIMHPTGIYRLVRPLEMYYTKNH